MEGGMIGDVVRRVADMVDEEAAKACEACRKDMAGRLMPDGLSWPIVDGQPVDFVTGYEPSLGVLEAVCIYSNGACEVMSHDGIIKGVKEIHVVKPKVLDADGVEIHVGDTVCGTRDMEPMRVVDADSRECGFKHIKCEKDGDGFFFYCADELTHKLPVLAADGRPLREGETVWDTNGDELVIGAFEDGGHTVTCRYADVGDAIPVHGMWSPSDLTHERPVFDADGVPIKVGDTVYFTDGREQECNTVVHAKYDYKDEPYVQLGRLNDVGYPTYTNCSCIDPSQLTHERPESWERLEHDAEKTVCEYFGANYDCANCPLEPARCDEEAKKDIIRRAKKLAERGE